MEDHWKMVVHSVVVGVLLFFIMLFGLKQKAYVAERRSILIAACVLIYMLLFGHRLPTKLKDI